MDPAPEEADVSGRISVLAQREDGFGEGEERVRDPRPRLRSLPSLDTPPRVLIAEDDFELRRLVAGHFRRAGYEVLEAANGLALADRLASALLSPDSMRIDLLVADQRMPGWTGLDALRSLRASRWRFPVILVTAFGEPEFHDEACVLGADAVFDKPFDLDVLLARARSLVPTSTSV